MFRKILIANRGEIAARVIHACRELGIWTVAVFSDTDRSALHVQMSDEAHRIGPPAPSESYLNIPNLLEIARQSKADAIHPGYGFLAENARFAQAVANAGLVFIGPPAEAIRLLGDKASARMLAERAGIPIVPGIHGVEGEHELAAAAQQLGPPLLVKASSGGGGKGMRLVHTLEEIPEAIAAARREAFSSFGDGRLILERYIPSARHIEFQILGDRYGSLVHVFERECSLQRRHQKIIEEAPSTLLDPGLREEMGAAAVSLAAAAGYANAGTVEFIVDPQTRRFFFLEMNTRLQVEHPITEAVSGLDLVQWQIRIAAGERLPFRQPDLSLRGHAIESRLYAEDPASGFLPAAGRLLRFIEPSGPGVRLDSGVRSGDEISPVYDPLIAKLIVWGEDRPSALKRMRKALRETVLLGLTNNAQFLLDILSHPDFETGQVHTTWIEDAFSGWQHPLCDLPPEVVAAAAVARLQAGDTQQNQSSQSNLSDPYNPWQSGGAFRLGES